MSLSFLSPLAALVALACLVPLGVLAAVRRTARARRRGVGLPEPARPALLVPLGLLLATALLLGLAASRPVLERTEPRHVRTDVEAIFVLDTTRSMLARSEPGATARIARAKAAAVRMRSALPGIPSGVSSLTDRMLPHLFPSPDEDTFRRTIDRSVGIERPPPAIGLLTNATRLEALSAAATRSFFSPTAARRLLVVLTDGESQPEQSPGIAALFRRPPRIRTIFVHTWEPGEKVFRGGVPEVAYRSDPAARAIVERLADQVDGEVFSATDLGAAIRAARRLAGTGPSVVQGERSWYVALAPYLVLAAALPLLALLWRRDR